MDSINQQQAEDSHEDLQHDEAVKKIKELTDKAKTCFFCTHSDNGAPMEVRPMSVQQVDDEGNFWFLSAEDSHKNQQVSIDHKVHLLFQGSTHSDFLSVYGKASISRDKKKIKELWEPIVKAWFTEGVDDPRITVIKVEPEQGYYWDTKHNRAIAGIKMLIGAAAGKTMDDSVEGDLKV